MQHAFQIMFHYTVSSRDEADRDLVLLERTSVLAGQRLTRGHVTHDGLGHGRLAEGEGALLNIHV